MVLLFVSALFSSDTWLRYSLTISGDEQCLLNVSPFLGFARHESHGAVCRVVYISM